MENQADKKDPKPMMNPYVFTVLLLAFGLWCGWDGWLATDTGMADYAVTMNRVAGPVLIAWAVWDFIKLRKRAAAGRQSDPSPLSGSGKG